MNMRGRPEHCACRERWRKRVVVGVTGHRLLSGKDSVIDGIDLVLRQIDRACGPRPITILSPLASGADQLVARRTLALPGAELVVPLPMPAAEYLNDFPAGSSRDAFLGLLQQAVETVSMPPTGSRVEAYEAVGLYIIEHSDVLIAIWDGKPARGQGGTGQIVAEARRRGLPLAWIQAENQARCTISSPSHWGEEGTVHFERFPPRSQDH